MPKNAVIPSAEEVGKLLERLEETADKTDETAVQTRQRVWEEISQMLGLSARELANQIAAGLGVSPVTSSRWIAGTFAPRPSHMKQLKTHLAGEPTPEPKMGIGLRPDQPVKFAGGFAALRTIDHFFYCLQFAKSSFVFKGLLEFHAGHQQKTRSRVVQALAQEEKLTIYYIFPKNSPANETFQELQKTVKSDYPEMGEAVLARMVGIGIPMQNDVLGLDFTFASPFVIVYDEKGRREFARSVDIWYEIPVAPVSAENEVNDDRELSVFVQLPPAKSKELWEIWKTKLQQWKQTDQTISIDESHLS